MNKLVKGSIAAATGIVLLMGGAGSLALWNDTASITGGAVTAGTLSIAAPATAPTTDGWKNSAGTVIPDISLYRIVPGDSISYTKTLNVTAIGNRLTAAISVDPTSVVAATTGNTAANAALASFITKNATFTVNGAAATTISASTTTQTVVVTATINFTSGAAGVENAAKTGVVNLNNFNINLVQTAVTP